MESSMENGLPRLSISTINDNRKITKKREINLDETESDIEDCTDNELPLSSIGNVSFSINIKDDQKIAKNRGINLDDIESDIENYTDNEVPLSPIDKVLIPIKSYKVLKSTTSSQITIKEQSINDKQIKKYECDGCKKIFLSRILIIEHFRNGSCLQACNFDFVLCNSSENLASHINIINDSETDNCIKEATYKCIICRNIIKNDNLIRRQQILNTNGSKLVCNICSMLNSIACGKDDYLKENFSWKCKTCGQSFTKLSTLKTHKCIRSENQLLECNKCCKTFVDLKNLEKHKIVHKFNYDVCLKQFLKKSSLTIRKRIHNLRSTDQSTNRPEYSNSNVPSQKYKCSKCSTVFHTRLEILNHLFENHQEIYNKYSCDGCTNLCDSSRDFILHLEKKFYKCEICPQSFSSTHILKQHYQWHIGLNTFKCQYNCPKVFSTFSRYLSHEKKHTGEQPFLCNFCGNWFPESTNKNIHLRSYKDFECNICQKTFTQKSSLLSHKRTHTTENNFENDSFNEPVNQPSTSEVRTGEQFKCTICDKEFFRLSTLNSHLMSFKNHKTIEKSSLSQQKRSRENLIFYKCDLCPKVFTDQNSLFTHGCRSYICTCCQRVFNNNSLLKRHYRYMEQQNRTNQILSIRNMAPKLNAKKKKDLKKKYKCNLCMERFSNQTERFNHILEIHF